MTQYLSIYPRVSSFLALKLFVGLAGITVIFPVGAVMSGSLPGFVHETMQVVSGQPRFTFTSVK